MSLSNVKPGKLLLLASFLMVTKALSEQECRSEAFYPTNQFLLGNNVHYLTPNRTSTSGYLVIVPEMRFKCHGYITGWSALTQFDSNEVAINNLYHDITFQLWRPSSRGSGVYTFVGSQTIAFVGNDLRSSTTVKNGIQYLNFTSAQSRDNQGERLVFEPEDVVGWYIHRLVQSIEIPMTVVYRPLSTDSATSDPGLRPVDMYTSVIADTAKANTIPPCHVSLHSDTMTVISSVIPYVTVDIELFNSPTSTLSETESGRVGTCVNTTINFGNLPGTTMPTSYTTNPPPTTPSSKLSDPSSNQSIVLTTGIVASLVLIAIVFNVIIVFIILYFRARMSNRQSSVKNEQSEYESGNDTVNEPRYCTHSDVKEVTTTANDFHTTDIPTKRNEAYGTSIVTFQENQ